MHSDLFGLWKYQGEIAAAGCRAFRSVLICLIYRYSRTLTIMDVYLCSIVKFTIDLNT